MYVYIDDSDLCHVIYDIEYLQVPHTKELKYLLKNVTRGTWYYAKVKANPKQYRIDQVRRQLKRAFDVPPYFSKIVACKTPEASE